MAASMAGEADRMPTAVTSFRTRVRVPIVLGVPARPIYTTRPEGSTRSRARAGRCGALDASITASNGTIGTVSSSQVCSKPRPRAKARDGSVLPSRCTSAPAARKNMAVSRPIVPGPSTRTPSPGQAAGPAVGDPDFLPARTDVLLTATAPPAGAVAEHGVAHDPAADPAGIDAGTDGRHPACPLVTESHRIGRMPVVQVGHLAGKELHVGAADSDALHIDDGFTGRGDWCRDLLDRVLPGPGQHERPHCGGRITQVVLTIEFMIFLDSAAHSGMPVTTATRTSTGHGCGAGCRPALSPDGRRSRSRTPRRHCRRVTRT